MRTLGLESLHSPQGVVGPERTRCLESWVTADLWRWTYRVSMKFELDCFGPNSEDFIDTRIKTRRFHITVVVRSLPRIIFGTFDGNGGNEGSEGTSGSNRFRTVQRRFEGLDRRVETRMDEDGTGLQGNTGNLLK